MNSVSKRTLLAVTVAAGAWFTSGSVMAFDADAAQALVRQNNCFRCHGVSKGKDGPAWKEVAAKYRGQAGAVDRVAQHLTSGEKAKFPDGHEEEHKIIKTDPPNDAAQIKNLAEWLLSL
jgi:cytochrome c